MDKPDNRHTSNSKRISRLSCKRLIKLCNNRWEPKSALSRNSTHSFRRNGAESIASLMPSTKKRSKNINIENKGSRLDKIDSTLEKKKGETKKRHKSMFDL